MPNVKLERLVHLLHHVGKGGETVKELVKGRKNFYAQKLLPEESCRV